MSDPLVEQRRSVGRVLGHIAVAIVILAVIAAAFWLSYNPVRDIARDAGVAHYLVRIYPGILDAAFLVTCGCALLLRGARWWTRLFAWLSVLVTGALIAAADVYQAAGLHLPRRTLNGVVWALPWALILLAFSLWISTMQHRKPTRAAEQDPAPGPSAIEGVPATRALPAPSPAGPGGLSEVGFGDRRTAPVAAAAVPPAENSERAPTTAEPRSTAESHAGESEESEDTGRGVPTSDVLVWGTKQKRDVHAENTTRPENAPALAEAAATAAAQGRDATPADAAQDRDAIPAGAPAELNETDTAPASPTTPAAEPTSTAPAPAAADTAAIAETPVTAETAGAGGSAEAEAEAVGPAEPAGAAGAAEAAGAAGPAGPAGPAEIVESAEASRPAGPAEPAEAEQAAPVDVPEWPFESSETTHASEAPSAPATTAADDDTPAYGFPAITAEDIPAEDIPAEGGYAEDDHAEDDHGEDVPAEGEHAKDSPAGGEYAEDGHPEDIYAEDEYATDGHAAEAARDEEPRLPTLLSAPVPADVTDRGARGEPPTATTELPVDEAELAHDETTPEAPGEAGDPTPPPFERVRSTPRDPGR
ncbi:MAG: hypothetical protein JO016_13690 [Actinobacteria bacterium]|nr:hypothetical protein [Actinomycetota bacterium]